tara:strand:+ start:1091 stop:1423 length:333 start_codon:yes stop_codon:yes gene_type:complete
MANIYKNAFLDLTTANTTVYTAPSDSRAIVQNIQVANDLTNNINVDVYIHDSSEGNNHEIAHDALDTKETINLAKGPVILEENDYLFANAGANNSAHLTLSILEINRNDQ